MSRLESGSKPPGNRPEGDKIPNPRDFLISKSPTTDTEKTLVAGFYIEMLSGKDSFDFDDIEQFFHQAKEAVPANRRDPPYQLVEKGLFRKIGKRVLGKTARNRWALTNDGISRVESGFSGGSTK